MGFVKLLIFGFIALTVIYVSVSLYSRSVRKERLEQAFDRDHPEGAAPGARDAFVKDGLIAYHKSFRPKLIGLIYVVPPLVLFAAVYTINAS